jgi:hypothetical protein
MMFCITDYSSSWLFEAAVVLFKRDERVEWVVPRHNCLRMMKMLGLAEHESVQDEGQLLLQQWAQAKAVDPGGGCGCI